VTVLAPTAVTVALEAACDYPGCAEMAFNMRAKLDTPKYTCGVSLMRCPDSRQQWEAAHRTARKRAWRAERLGYTFAEIDRSRFNDDIHEINTSLCERQGRPMTEGYVVRHNHRPLPAYPCWRHSIFTFGVLQGETLRAYLTLYRIGDLALVSMILGHGDHLRNDIMYALAAGMIDHQAGWGGFFYYNRHDSGTDGLRFYKERIGFTATDIQWVL
jgi:hypothetical protein